MRKAMMYELALCGRLLALVALCGVAGAAQFGCEEDPAEETGEAIEDAGEEVEEAVDDIG